MISVSAQSVRYSKVKLNLYLFRHGKTAFNESGLLSGTSDDPLTEEGVYQLKKWLKNSNARQPMLYFPVRCPVASKPPQSFTQSPHQLLFLIYERSVSGNWSTHPFRIFSPAISGGNCSAMILLSAFPEEKASRTAWTALFILWIPSFLRHVNRGGPGLPFLPTPALSRFCSAVWKTKRQKQLPLCPTEWDTTFCLTAMYGLGTAPSHW